MADDTSRLDIFGDGGTVDPDPTPPRPAPYSADTAVSPSAVPDAGPPMLRGARMRTVVFGLVLAVIAVSVTLADITDVHVDFGAVAIGVMIVAGILLVAGSRRRTP